MICPAGESDETPNDPGDRGHDPERRLCVRQHRSLLVAARGTTPAAPRACTRHQLLRQPVSSSRITARRVSVRLPDRLHGGEPRDHAERAVEAARPPAPSREEPVQTSGNSGERPGKRPTTLPRPSTSTSRPASSNHPTARAQASSSSGDTPTRFAPTPRPMWKTSSSRRSKLALILREGRSA